MVKSEIIEKLVECLASQAYNITKREIRETAKTTVDAIFNAMLVALSKGQRIEIRGFGSFSLKKRAAGLVRNPRYTIINLLNQASGIMYISGLVNP